MNIIYNILFEILLLIPFSERSQGEGKVSGESTDEQMVLKHFQGEISHIWVKFSKFQGTMFVWPDSWPQKEQSTRKSADFPCNSKLVIFCSHFSIEWICFERLRHIVIYIKWYGDAVACFARNKKLIHVFLLLLLSLFRSPSLALFLMRFFFSHLNYASLILLHLFPFRLRSLRFFFSRMRVEIFMCINWSKNACITLVRWFCSCAHAHQCTTNFT